LRAIGGAAVVNLVARFCLDNCSAWIGAAAQPIAAKARSQGGRPVLQRLGHVAAADVFQMLKVGQCAGYLEQAVGIQVRLPPGFSHESGRTA